MLYIVVYMCILDDNTCHKSQSMFCHKLSQQELLLTLKQYIFLFVFRDKFFINECNKDLK